LTGKAMGRTKNWVLAAAGAIALNLGLFALMPYLLSSDPEKPYYEKIVSNIRIIRMQEETIEEPEPMEPPAQKDEQEPEPEPSAPLQRPVDIEMSLPFEINPRLPSGPHTVELPPMMMSGVSISRDMFSAADLDHPMTAVSRIPPVYPMNARRRNIEGWVSVRFVVDKDGRVESVAILEEKPPGVFDRAVIDCVSAWRFNPGTIGGVPVRTVAETTIRFELD
jgi:periplasmic protein TonB